MIEMLMNHAQNDSDVSFVCACDRATARSAGKPLGPSSARFRRRANWLLLMPLLLVACRPVVDWTDREVAAVIAERQREALDYTAPISVPVDDELFAAPPRSAYAYDPNPRSSEIPAGFQAEGVTTQPAGTWLPTPTAPVATLITAPTSTAPASQPAGPAGEVEGRPLAAGPPETTQPSARPGGVFTLTDALAYAQRHQRAYQTAKEELYLVALDLTLERHLWSPIFSSNLRTVYGNYGEITDFDQAMRFVADLSVSQRLPYGGEFTAQAVSTLIRDVKKTITASEGSWIELEVRVPFLRNAGHVAQEDLIQLERELTYAVRVFERFRRRQLVNVAASYFGLLRAKQNVLDTEKSLERVFLDFGRARALQESGFGTLLDTQRAEQQYLSSENRLADQRESVRAQADQFKLLIGMPVDAPLGIHDIQDIDTVETRIAEGEYPLLLRPAAVNDEGRAIVVALENRLDLLNAGNRIEDARRGVAVAKNALLPDLDLTSSVAWDTDPDRYKLGDFSFERTTWRSELLLSLPLERTRERNRYRATLIGVRRAERNYVDSQESIRAEVRSAVNGIRLEERSLEIQRRNLQVADRRLEFAELEYEDGRIEVREKLDAENDWNAARARLNQAKTSGWTALLQFRLATGTLRIDENGVQHADTPNSD